MPSLLSLTQNYQGKPFKVLLVNVQEDKETVQQFFAKKQIALQVVLDEEGMVSKSYHVTSHPIKFLIDGQGNLIALGIGYKDWDSPEMNRLVNSLIENEEQTPSA